MENKISARVKAKAEKIVSKEKVRKEFETDKRIHFIVEGETETHSVIFDKQRKKWECDCRFSSLKQGICSHILACKIKEKE